tara:strand:- start:376 stop:549 length:174 start_codon:yes stop_codon:yes gene_type:complete
MIDNCEFMERCPDIERLNRSEIEGRTDKDLVDQHENLCTFAKGFGCSIREGYVGANK